ncbi:MAG: hypothetical protein ACE5DW_04010 [Thermodesulfobacteriota bacterium]
MRKILITALTIFTTCLLGALPVRAGTAKTYCEANYRSLHKSLAGCIESEALARRWIATNPVPDDIYSYCKSSSGRSLSLFKDCVLKETYVRNTRSLSPYNLNNSEVWYASPLRKLFPSQISACGASRPIDDIAVMAVDITKFHFSTSMIYKDMLPLLTVKGRVKIAAVPLPMHVKKKKLKRSYNLYLDAFLINSDGKVVDITSAHGKAPLSARGGTARFSFNIGKGYYFEKGARLLVVASGEPITSNYPEASCVLLGAKRLTFKK